MSLAEAIKHAILSKNTTEALQVAQRFLTTHQGGSPIDGSLVGQLLHLCHISGLTAESVAVVEGLMATDFIWDSKCRSRAISVLCKQHKFPAAFSLLERGITSGEVRRRDFEPIFDHCNDERIADYARHLAKINHVLLDDEDYARLIEKFPTAARIHEVLNDMKDDIPIVSSRFAKALHSKIFIQNATMNEAGVCSVCNTRLALFPFTEATRLSLLQDVESLPLIRERARPRVRDMFEQIRRTPMDVLIDGANVGYSALWRRDPQEVITPASDKKRSHPTHFPVRLEHIEACVQEARTRGLRPIIMLHHRHTNSEDLLDKYQPLVARWSRERILMPTPSGVEDDICWLYAAVYHSSSTKRAFVVTNDLMRDHIFRLLSRKLVSRFRDTARVTYRILPPRGTQAELFLPPPFSTALQFSMDKLMWHVPMMMEEEGDGEVIRGGGGDCGSPEVTWLCVDLSKGTK